MHLSTGISSTYLTGRYCVDIDVSKHFYVDILGFSIKYQRPEKQFLFLTLGGVDLMLEGLNSEGRKWLTGDMNTPFGRGVKFDVIPSAKLRHCHMLASKAFNQLKKHGFSLFNCDLYAVLIVSFIFLL